MKLHRMTTSATSTASERQPAHSRRGMCHRPVRVNGPGIGLVSGSLVALWIGSVRGCTFRPILPTPEAV